MQQVLSFSIRPDDGIVVEQLRRVLVIKLRHHGDVLLTSPVISALKAAAPQAEIDALVYQDTQDMLSLHPDLNQLHLIDRNWKRLGPLRQLRKELGLLKRLRMRRYDLVIHLTEHNRGAWLTRLLAPRWSAAREGDYGKFFDRSFTHRFAVVGGNARHTVQLHLDALRRLGIYPARLPNLTLATAPATEQTIDTLLAEHGLAKRGFILVHPGSRWLFKCWPVDKMQALLRRLQQDGHKLVLTGAPDKDEAAMLSAIVSALDQPVLNLQGKLSLKELAALIARARLFIGVDSAPMHMAAAMQTPTVVFFGPSGDGEWGPWQVANRMLRSQHPCRPCGRDGCGGGKRSECLEVLAVDDAYRAVADLLVETA